MYHPTRLLILGFAIVILMMIVLAFFAFDSTRGGASDPGVRIAQHLDKIKLITQLTTTIHDRTRLLQTMLLGTSESESERNWSDFMQMNAMYLETSQQLRAILTPREQEALEAIKRLDDHISDTNRQFSALLFNGSRNAARQVFQQEILPASESMLAGFADLAETQELAARDGLTLASNDDARQQNQIAIFSVIAVLVSLLVTSLAVWYGQKLSTQLEDMNNYLEQKIYDRTESLLDTQKELQEDNNELTRMAMTDSLTGLANRSNMDQILRKEFARFERHNQRFGIIMLDIDRFKLVNDNFGHLVGDSVLIRLGQLFESAIRSSDFVARWGGEEFLICCTTIEEEDLLPIAETIRKLVASTEFDSAGHLTISLGCAAIVKGEAVDEVIHRADIALYEAKNNGRNMSVVSEFTDISIR